MNDTELWLIDWFKANNNFDHSIDIEKTSDINIFESGLIDSLGIMNLIDEIESTYDIELNHNHFEQRRFSTIKGLSEIIDEEKK